MQCGLRRMSWVAGSMMSGRPRGEGLGIPSPHLGCYTASPGRYTNTGRRVVLVSLYGLSYLTVTCSLFSWFDSGYNLRQSTLASVGTETGTHSASCACFERLHRCSSWTRCARTSLCNNRCRLSSGRPCCGAEAVPHGPFVHAHGAVLGQGFLMSFTVPLNGWTIVATATVVTSCSLSGDCPVWGCLRRDVVWWWRCHS